MAEYEHFTFDQGSDVAVEVHLVDASDNPKDLTNYSAAAQLKKNYLSDSADTTDFAVAISAPPTQGIVTMSLTNTQTAALRQGRYVYDLEISYTDSNGATIIERVLEGKITLAPEVTTV